MTKRPMEEPIKIGFWYSETDPTLPMPVIAKINHSTVASPGNLWSTTFIEKCKQLVAFLDKLHNQTYKNTDNFSCQSYRGMSPCRLCDNQCNGNMEITFNGYVFPEGLMHYIIDHNIIIDQKFMKMIIDSSLPDVFEQKTKVFSLPLLNLDDDIDMIDKIKTESVEIGKEGYLEKCVKWRKLNDQASDNLSFSGDGSFVVSRNLLKCEYCSAQYPNVSFEFKGQRFGGDNFHNVLNHDLELPIHLKSLIEENPVPCFKPNYNNRPPFASPTNYTTYRRRDPRSIYSE